MRRGKDPLPSAETNRLPAKTTQNRETRLSALAFDLVEKRLKEGTASSQETVWALKLGSTREAIEKEKIQYENELLAVKKQAIESQKRVEELYFEALKAMRSYSGQRPASEDAIDLDASQYEVNDDPIVF